MTASRPIVGVSLKAYFDRDRLTRWLTEVSDALAQQPGRLGVDVFVLPDFLGIPLAVRTLAGTGVAVGGQDVSAGGPGATTGEVPAARLAEEGCTLVAVGHAERRASHGETDAVVAAKVAQLVAAGLTPLVCVGEEAHDRARAASVCARQIEVALTACRCDQHLLIAYEPIWAIGAAEPASASHVRAVLGELRDHFPERKLSFLYGGSAGPGLFAQIGDVADGLFLGRFAHDPDAFAAVVAEAGRRRAPTNPS